MFKVTLIACLVSSITAASVGSQPHEVEISGHTFVKENVLTFTEYIPMDLVVDFHTENLYYISSKSGSGYDAYILRKNSNQPELIPGMTSTGQAVGIDQTNGIVYVGTDKGLYKYDDSTKTSTKINYTSQHDIIYVDIANNGSIIYYLEFVSEKSYRLAADLKTPVEVVSYLVEPYDLKIDQQNNFYYTDVKVPYVLKNGQKNSTLITKNGKDITIQDFAVDIVGRVLAIDSDGNIYMINGDEANAVVIGKVNLTGETTSITADSKGNLYIGYKFGILKLKKM